LLAAVEAAIGTEIHADTFQLMRNRVTRLQSPKLLRHLNEYSVQKERKVELFLCSPWGHAGKCKYIAALILVPRTREAEQSASQLGSVTLRKVDFFLLNVRLGGPQCLSALSACDNNLLLLLGVEPPFPTVNPYRRHYAGYVIQDIV